MSEFVPKTEMERMFVQTVGWDALRLWRRLTYNIERRNWSHAAVMTLGLTFIYLQKSVSPSFSAARRADLERDAQRNMEYLEEDVFDKLSIEDQHSFFRVSQFVLATLSETEASYVEGPLALILKLMHKIYFRENNPKIMHLEQALLLQKLYGSDDWSEKFRWKKVPPDLRTTTHAPLQLPPVEDLERLGWKGKEQTIRAQKDSLPFVPEAGREFISELGIYVEVFGDKFVFQTDERFSHHENWRLKIVKIHVGGEAHQAGWRVGDVILSINSFPVSSVDDLRMSYASLLPSEVVTVKIKRDNEIKSYRVNLRGSSVSQQHKKPEVSKQHDLLFAGHKARFYQLNAQLSEATTKYGIKSDQATHALISLACFVGKTKIFGANIYVYELIGILDNVEIFVSPYDLRRIYYLSRDLLHDPKDIELSQKLQEQIFSRRIAEFGRDMGMAVPFTRLVGMWNATNRLKEGAEFCDALVDWARKSLPKDDLICRQIESAAKFVNNLRSELSRPEQFGTSDRTDIATVESALEGVFPGCGELKLAAAERAVQVGASDDWKETDEFIAMLSLVALDSLNSKRFEQTDFVLQELLSFFAECEGEDSRRVGEMLWALMETPLRERKAFREELIKLSMRAAVDKNRRARFYYHVRRLVMLQVEKVKVDATLSFIAKDCSSISPSTAKLLHEQLLHFAVKDRKQYVKLNSTMMDLDSAEKEFSKVLSKDKPLSKGRLQFANELGEQLWERFIHDQLPDRAIEIIRELLAQANQSRESVTLLLTRLAYAQVVAGNIFEATAVLYLAFNIPDADDFIDPESEPPVAEISA